MKELMMMNPITSREFNCKKIAKSIDKECRNLKKKINSIKEKESAEKFSQQLKNHEKDLKVYILDRFYNGDIGCFELEKLCKLINLKYYHMYLQLGIMDGTRNVQGVEKCRLNTYLK